MACWTLGVDLAKVRDYSAAVLVEHLAQFVGLREVGRVSSEADFPDWRAGEWDVTPDGRVRVVMRQPYYRVRGIQRWERGTPTHVVVAHVGRLLEKAPGDPTVVYDRTGMGGVVGEEFERAYRQRRLGRHWPYGVAITSGREANPEAGTVPKSALVGQVSVALAERRLELPEEHPLSERLRTELGEFSVKWTTAGNMTFEARTESVHDDLVMALALAVHTKGRGRPEALGDPAEEAVG